MHPFFEVPKPTVIGHRGSAGTAPENTLRSFRVALAQGAAILETDVHLSRDGVPLLLHDATIDRTTGGAGAAAALDWSTLCDFEVYAEPSRASGGSASEATRSGERIPSLEEAFEAFPSARFNLEIKSADPRAIDVTLDLVRAYDRADRTLLAAGEDDIMQALRGALRRHALRPATGACVSEIVGAVGSAVHGAPMPEGVMALQVPATFMSQPLVTAEFVAHAHAHHVAVHVWTINDRVETEALLALGVDGIVTDYPGRLAAWLREGFDGEG